MSTLTPAVARESVAGELRCASCGSALAGRFCSHCGEEVMDRHALTVRHFLWHTILHDFAHLDGKLWSTLNNLIFHPGALPAAYFEGRRKIHVRPVRLVLLCLVAFALLAPSGTSANLQAGKLRLSLLPPQPPNSRLVEATIEKLDVLGILSRQWAVKKQSVALAPETAAEKFNHELKTYGTALSFCNFLLVSLLLFVLLRNRRPYFVEHLVFSIHLGSFVLVLGILELALLTIPFHVSRFRPEMGRVPGGLLGYFIVIGGLGLLVQCVYLYCALRRFYYADAGSTAWVKPKIAGLVIVVFLGNSLFMTIAHAAGASIALARL